MSNKNNLAWWKETVFYQIYPRSFCDSNGDGVGDIPGIISKLDYLRDLGVGAIWLSPVYISPNEDFGYDVADYRSINPEYGDMKDMKELIKQAKERDIRIVMDLVANHTSDEHEWFQSSRDPKSPYRDYYIWRDGRKGLFGRELLPNNWGSYFMGSAWQKDDKSGQYYLHLFSKKQPDLNYYNPKVIQEIESVMRFWLDMGVAGFRCDVINLLYKQSFENSKITEFAIKGSEYYTSAPAIHKILKHFRKNVLLPYKAFTIGETMDMDSQTAKLFTNHELDMVFAFDHMNVDKTAIPIIKRKYKPKNLKSALQKWQVNLDWNSLFFENHDQPRSVDRFGDKKDYYRESATMLATILLTLRGTPFIYQGQEIGMTNFPFRSVSQVRDISAINIYKLLRHYLVPKRLANKLSLNLCRDTARTPMQWDNEKNAGFSKSKPWLPVTPNYGVVNVRANQEDPDSIYAYYHQLVDIRKNNLAIQYGSIYFIELGRDILAYERKFESDKYLIINNMGDKKYKFKKPFTGRLVISNYPHAQSDVVISRLKAYESIVLKLE